MTGQSERALKPPNALGEDSNVINNRCLAPWEFTVMKNGDGISLAELPSPSKFPILHPRCLQMSMLIPAKTPCTENNQTNSLCLATRPTTMEPPHNNFQTASGRSAPAHILRCGPPGPHIQYSRYPESVLRWHC